MNSSCLWRMAPIFIFVPLALADCGGSDNSDINGGGGHLRDGGASGAAGDASDAHIDVFGPTPGCPVIEPIPGRNCPAPMLACSYGDRLCVCTSDVPWSCFDIVDAGSTPDGSGGAGGAGGTSVDGGGNDGSRPPDGGAGRAGAGGGSTVDAQTDTGRDAGRGGGGGAGGTGGGGTGGGGAGRDGGARDVTTRDAASDARDGARDGSADTRADTPAEDVDDGGTDDGNTDDGLTDDGTSEASVDSGDDGG